MAASREKRSNAGTRMASLLEQEDEDDFYKTTYGGFNEEEDDNEYESEVSESDYEDSDIDIDENDEVKSDEEDEPVRKKRTVNTKAYKEPVQKKPKTETKPKVEKKKTSKPPPSIQIYKSSPDKKTLRKTTSVRSQERVAREKEREEKAKLLKDIAAQKRVAEVRRLTQEELLEEAKITEELNLQALENYQRLELEKKSRRVVKTSQRGPMIRYHSLTMPLVEELPEDEIEEEENAENHTKENQTNGKDEAKEKCERTFITFTDERTFKEYFMDRKYKQPVKQFCPVTRLPAKYFDPVTQTPYATLQAFKIIREAYAQQLQSDTTRGAKNANLSTDTIEVTVK